MNKVCVVCGISITHKRKNARFCSDACRAEHWREKGNFDFNSSNSSKPIKEKDKELTPDTSLSFGSSHLVGLKNVIHDKGNSNDPFSIDDALEYLSSDNPKFNKVQTKLNGIKAKIFSNEQQLKSLFTQQKELMDETPEAILPYMGFGMGFVYATQEDEFWKAIRDIAIGAFGGLASKSLIRFIGNWRLEKIENNIKVLQSEILELAKESKLVEKRLEKIPKYLELDQVEEKENDDIEQNNKYGKVIPTNEGVTSEKIINSKALENMNFKSLNFKGKWFSLFGQPAVNFHLVIHGKPGQGKSTFSLQFANYLASSFGKVIYVSGEEGFSKTMKDKLKLNKAFHPQLYIADLRNYDELLNHVTENSYHFIFIDSLNNMGIGINELKSLRERFKHSGLITISQSTKTGALRGSLEVEHEADISLKVEKGLAFTTKNRFKELGYNFKIFNDINV